MLQTQTVTAETLALTKRLMADPNLADFILVGGTALALTIGHRQSIDIDLFTDRSFDAPAIASILEKDYGAKFMRVLKNGVFCSIEGVKTDLISHQYPHVNSPETIEGIRIMSLPDIAAMKLHAIVQSGSRVKDFADIYFLLERMPLSKMYEVYEEKYYPDVIRQMARSGLQDHSRVNFKEEVMLVNAVFDWGKVAARIQKAVEHPSVTFETSQTQQQVQRRQRKHGKRRGLGH
jgi:hypothetical protein